MSRRIRLTLFSFPVLAAISLSGCFSIARMAGFRAEGSFERTLAVSGPVELEIYSNSGHVSIVGGLDGEVRLNARVTARSASRQGAQDQVRDIEDSPPIRQDGNRIVLGYTDGGDGFDNVSIRYDLEVPVTTSVVARTGSGGVDVRDLVGDVEVRSGSGHLDLADLKGAVRVQTGSGGIDADGIAGPFDGRTGSGGIRLGQEAPGGEVDVNTGSGGIALRGVRGRLRARAASGGIDGAGQPGQRWELTAGSGGVTLTLPSDAAFELDAQTRSGSVEVDHDIRYGAERPDRNRRRVRGSVGEGGADLEVRSGSGSIRILGD
jgi:hypothetical protein